MVSINVQGASRKHMMHSSAQEKKSNLTVCLLCARHKLLHVCSLPKPNKTGLSWREKLPKNPVTRVRLESESHQPMVRM